MADTARRRRISRESIGKRSKPRDFERTLTPLPRATHATPRGIKFPVSMVERQRWLADRSIRYLLVFAPDKHSIYGQHLPASIRKVGDRSRLDQLVGLLKESTDIDVIDLRSSLRRASRKHRTYHRTDSHWNDFGAFIGYEAMMRRIARWFPSVNARSINEFTLSHRETDGCDLAMMLGLQDLLREDRIDLKPKFERAARIRNLDSDAQAQIKISQTDLLDAPKMVVFHDSFMGNLMPYLCEHFARIFFQCTFGFDCGAIQQEQPAIVVQEIVERVLQVHEPSNPSQLSRESCRWASNDETVMR